MTLVLLLLVYCKSSQCSLFSLSGALLPESECKVTTLFRYHQIFSIKNQCAKEAFLSDTDLKHYHSAESINVKIMLYNIFFRLGRTKTSVKAA